jgi:tripartite-type tricarboxylate transporter receptor subunit TctC
MAPRGTSSELVSRLNTAFNKALSHQDTTRVLTNQGIEPVRETPAYFRKRLQEDATTYKAVVEQIGLTPQ